MENLIIKASDGLELSTAFFPVSDAKGVVQIVHGALEHKERYYDFICFLNKNGYSAIICDNRGHGASTNSRFPRGYMNGVNQMLDDMYRVTLCAKELCSDTPLHMLGHSFGSCLVRCYLQKHDDELKSLILSGTANYQKNVFAGMIIGRVITAARGGYTSSSWLTEIDKEPDTSWLSYNEENNRRARNDKLSFQYYTNRGQLTVWESDYRLKKYHQYRCKNPSLRILSVTGEDDFISGGRSGLDDTERTLRKIGYQDITIINYPHMKHEPLNEVNNQIVYNDILKFLSVT